MSKVCSRQGIKVTYFQLDVGNHRLEVLEVLNSEKNAKLQRR